MSWNFDFAAEDEAQARDILYKAKGHGMPGHIQELIMSMVSSCENDGKSVLFVKTHGHIPLRHIESSAQANCTIEVGWKPKYL
jgi:hypothetical protein